MFLAATKLGPALAAGNTVVLKASEQAPAPMFEFAKLVHEAGFPPGVVNVITGWGEPCGRALTSHPLVARVAFTGGPETARHVVRNTAENFAHLSLELGGKSPIVVFDDADLDGAVNGVIAGNLVPVAKAVSRARECLCKADSMQSFSIGWWNVRGILLLVIP